MGEYQHGSGGAISPGAGSGVAVVEGSSSSAGGMADMARAMRLIWGGVPDREYVEITVRSGKKWKTAVAELENAIENGLPAAVRASQGGADVYYGVSSLTEVPPEGRRGGRRIRGSAGVLFADLDLEAPGRVKKGWESVEEAAEAALVVAEGLWGSGVRDSALVVDTGWGCHVLLVLADRVPAGLSGELSNAWAQAIGQGGSGGKADKIGDPSRILRMPFTWNWRGGPDQERQASVVKWPADGARLVLPRTEDGAYLVGNGGWALTADGGGGGAAALVPGPGGEGGALLDWNRLAGRVWTWAEILEPAGLVCLGSNGAREAEVWVRWGRAQELDRWSGTGTRSAVVYADAPDMITIFSDAIPGLEGRGGSVFGKWDMAVALGSALVDGDAWTGAMAAELDVARGIVSEWVELARLSGEGSVRAAGELERRRAAALAEVEQ